MDCAQASREFRNPVFLRAARAHVRSCSSCMAAVGPETAHDEAEVRKAAEEFVSAANRFFAYVLRLGAKLESPGNTDPARAIASMIAQQIHEEYETYSVKYRDDNTAALCWLQKAFVVCRFFRSEDFFDDAMPFEQPKKRVGEMPVPPQRGVPSASKFGTVTSLSHEPQSPEEFGLPVLNADLHAKIRAELTAGKWVHALTLICDSPKHGVLSPLLNLAATATPEFVYQLGLTAMARSIDAFRMDAENPIADL